MRKRIKSIFAMLLAASMLFTSGCAGKDEITDYIKDTVDNYKEAAEKPSEIPKTVIQSIVDGRKLLIGDQKGKYGKGKIATSEQTSVGGGGTLTIGSVVDTFMVINWPK